MPKITLEQAVDQRNQARGEYHLALARLAVCQYQHELAQRLGVAASLLVLKEIQEGGLK